MFDSSKIDASHSEIATYDLTNYRNIYVIGAGKAAQRMAKTVEDVLGIWITDGHINTKKGKGKYLNRIRIKGWPSYT